MNAYRAAAWADLGLFAALAAPVLSRFVIDTLLRLDVALFGSVPAHPGPLAYVLAQLLGVLGAGFAIVRLEASDGDWLWTTISVKLAAAAVIALGVVSGAPTILLAIAGLDALIATVLLARRHAL